MWKIFCAWLFLYGCCAAVPYGGKRNMPIMQHEVEPQTAAATENAAQMQPEGAIQAELEMDAAAALPPSAAVPTIHSTLTLPSNATSIRADIVDGFSCANRSYGYYADVENDCQIFHVCLPVTYANGKENIFRWSFICPEDTIFSQDSFTCMRREDMTIDCEDSYQYYELNRNFGTVDEDKDNNRHRGHGSEASNERHPLPTINKNDAEPDQQIAMTQHLTNERPQRPMQAQFASIATVATQPQPTQSIANANDDEKIVMMKPSDDAVNAAKPQKPKPPKSPKPNRRKPAIAVATSAFASSSTASTSATASVVNLKKKPQRKVPSTMAATTTAAPLNDATTLAAIAAEIKPITANRFTKRPIMSNANNLKEKLQQAATNKPPADNIPIRIELYNQKRKRPTFMSKKDTTAKPTVLADEATTSTAPEDLPATTTATATKNSPQYEVTAEASEAQVSYVKPTATSMGDNKKIAKPQPTEPEAEMPAVKPLEAFEEIPAVIAEVVETNENTNTDDNIKVHTPDVAVNGESPAIFQPNSEEIPSIVAPSIEEMEQEKPHDAPELVTAATDLEQQQQMVEQMFGETMENTNDDDNKQTTMGGFKPVDPAMAAEAEALIANFLNTLMKTEQVGGQSDGESAKPAITESQISNEITADKINDNITTEPALVSNVDTKQTPIATNSLPAAADAATIAALSPLPSIMMMHSHPGEMFQIPVQVIQTPIEELPSPVTPDTPAVKQPNNKPLSIDDIVDLVKVQLDQKPTTVEAQTPAEQEVPTTQSSPTTLPITNDESKYQKLGEELILPIYQRKTTNPAPSQQMLKAPSESDRPNGPKDQPQPQVEVVSAGTGAKAAETNKNETETKKSRKAQRKAAKKSRSIKQTISHLNPRKRQFLFRSDAS